ncbi:hypothetical protein J6590_023170 [Homalodisca vitripennis]|nr:hypothetical protein J6590_023170 [Homalodisca vitripennis]
MGQNESRKVGRPTTPFSEAQERNSRMSDLVHTRPNPQIISMCPSDKGIKIQTRDNPVANKPKEFSIAQPSSTMTSSDSGETFHKPLSSANDMNKKKDGASSNQMLASTLKSSLKKPTQKPQNIEIASFNIKDSVNSLDSITEHLHITDSSPKQYKEGELHNLPSSNQAPNYSNFPDQVAKDIYHVASKRNDQLNFTATSERRFLSSKLNADVSKFKKELNKEKDQFHTKERFCISPTNNVVDDSINEISKNKTDQAIDISEVSCLPSSLSEISHKNKGSSNLSMANPSFFDSNLLLPIKMSTNSGNLHETNKANIENETESVNNQPTLNIKSNSTDSHTKFQKNINCTLEDSQGRIDPSKKNLRSNYKKCTVSYPLKHIEKLANNVCSLSPQKGEKTIHISNKSLNEGTDSSQQISLHGINPNRYFSLQECIYEMANFDTENKEMIPSLQQSLLINLQTINSFISVIKTFPSLNKVLIKEIDSLKENISLFSGDKFSKNMDDYSASVFHMETTPSIIAEAIESDDSRRTFNITDMRMTTDILDGDTNSKDLALENVRILSKNTSFEHLSEEVNNFNSEKRDYRSEKLLRESQYQGNKKEQLGLSDTNDDVIKKSALPQKYEGVLNIVYDSFKKNLVLDVSLYICRLCDDLANNEEDANSHLSSENHTKCHLEDAKWHICSSCCLNIFGTDEHFKEHCSTLQHNAVFNLKNPHSEKLSPGNDAQKSDDTFDCASVCSSRSNMSMKEEHKRLKPHEILLAIAKDSLNKKNGSSLGLYCQICNKYTIYSGSSTEDHFKTDKHISKLNGCKNCSLRFCKTCNVDLFGDRWIWEEHIKMQLHLELSSLGEKRDNTDQERNESEVDNTNESTELSNEEGPHFDLMKAIIRKHIDDEPTNTIFGFYCHTCEAYFLDEHNWKSHIMSASHFNRINSSECLGKQLCHECKVCNIIFIGDGNVFSSHMKTVVHQAINRLKQRGNPVQTKRENFHSVSEDGSSLEDTDDSEDENATVDGSDSQSATSSSKKYEKPQVNRNGIYVTGKITSNVFFSVEWF